MPHSSRLLTSSPFHQEGRFPQEDIDGMVRQIDDDVDYHSEGFNNQFN